MQELMSETWGFYSDINDARSHLCAYTDSCLGRNVGVTWTAGGFIYPMRAPKYRDDGLADVLMVELADAASTKQPQPSLLQRLESLVDEGLGAYGRTEMQISEANAAMMTSITSMFTPKRMDALGVALDVICVATSFAALPAAPLIGAIAFAAGVFLLATDGSAFVLEMSDREKLADRVKKSTEPYRVAAMVLSLPDFFVGGARAVRELAEAVRLRPLDVSTAIAADGLKARTTNMTRADKYAQIAEKARLRTQLRSEQIKGSWTHEVTPRSTVPPSLALLVKEESDPESWSRQFLSRLRFHVVSVGHAKTT